ncbi:MAG: glutamate racemase [Deltaproteobacteria bacterium]|nr:glutamate racemase [Deltaproteobacteria bacterium]
MNDRPIGVFDSGLGGLTVVREIRRQLPAEKIVYLGDSARVPYGTRSAETVIRYARKCADFLDTQDLKMLVVACNTASSVALPALREDRDVPVLGVITAGARAAVDSGALAVGVIGTAGTIHSNAYASEIAKLSPEVIVHQEPAPLFVPLAEEGWVDGEVPLLAAERYLAPLVEHNIGTLLLGCTHYPLLKGTIGQALHKLGSGASIIDSATAMTRDIMAKLDARDLQRDTSGNSGGLSCYVTDLPDSFREVAGRFLGESDPLGDVEVVDI